MLMCLRLRATKVKVIIHARLLLNSYPLDGIHDFTRSIDSSFYYRIFIHTYIHEIAIIIDIELDVASKAGYYC